MISNLLKQNSSVVTFLSQFAFVPNIIIPLQCSTSVFKFGIRAGRIYLGRTILFLNTFVWIIMDVYCRSQCCSSISSSTNELSFCHIVG